MDAALGLLGLGTPCEITIDLNGSSDRRYVNQTGTTTSSSSHGRGGGGGGGGVEDGDNDYEYDYEYDDYDYDYDGEVVGGGDGGDGGVVDGEGAVDVGSRKRRGQGVGVGMGMGMGRRNRKGGNRKDRGRERRDRERHRERDKERERDKDGGLLPLYNGDETVSGEVTIEVRGGKTVQHRGIKVEFVGSIDMLYDREHCQEFTSLERLLEDPGVLTGGRTVYKFEFTNVCKQYDTYRGINVSLRYFLRVTVVRAQYTPDITKTVDICVRHETDEPPSNLPIRMEVGIEDALHIEFEYNKSKFHLHDVVIGKIYFLLVRLDIKRMEVEIRKRESAGSGPNVYNETDTVMKFQVMDGPPTAGQSIPVRMFLAACKGLTPTYRSVNNKFSVKYYLNLVLVDRDDRRYFKQSEITIWRAKTG